MDSSGEKRMVTSQSNPLLIYPVINCIFDHLPFEDIKKCRLVCQEWNSVSKQILNEKSIVKLDSEERMTRFLEFYNAYDTQPLPTTTFFFKYSHANGNTEKYEKLMSLSNALRENVATLICPIYGDRFHLTPLIASATNLVRLELSSINSVLELNMLAKVKYLSLICCCLSLDSFENRIVPFSICMMLVTFERNGNKLQEILINDYIDFSRCFEITIMPRRDFAMSFDMSRDIVSAPKVHFEALRVINRKTKPAKADKRILSFEKQASVGIKQLTTRNCQLNLSVLPKSLEKLSLNRNTYGAIDWVSIDLPHLKYLIFKVCSDDTTAKISPTAYDMGVITSKFRLCPQLVDMELSGLCLRDGRCDINVDLMPVTLKRIKLSNNKNINLVGETVIHVEVLILDTATFADAQKFMNKIKPNILVVKLQRSKVKYPAYEIVCFAEESLNLEKIVIKVPVKGDSSVLNSYENTLSSYVEDDDRESKWYVFTNMVGKYLTREEYNLYWF